MGAVSFLSSGWLEEKKAWCYKSWHFESLWHSPWEKKWACQSHRYGLVRTREWVGDMPGIPPNSDAWGCPVFSIPLSILSLASISSHPICDCCVWTSFWVPAGLCHAADLCGLWQDWHRWVCAIPWNIPAHLPANWGREWSSTFRSSLLPFLPPSFPSSFPPAVLQTARSRQSVPPLTRAHAGSWWAWAAGANILLTLKSAAGTLRPRAAFENGLCSCLFWWQH